MTRVTAARYSRVVKRGLQHANAFVIQFRAAAAGAKDFSGRIEHVPSARTASFRSVQELPQLFLDMLATVAADESNDDGSPQERSRAEAAGRE